MSAPQGAPPPYPGNPADPGYPTQAPYPPTQPGYPPPGPAQYSDPTKQGGGYGQPYGQQPYPPPNQGYGAPPQGTTVVVAQPALTVVQSFRESPVHTNCPHCRAEIVTGIHFETGTLAWVICCVLWWIGCGLGCCLIPFCVDGCKDVIHTCPNCHQQIARFSRM